MTACTPWPKPRRARPWGVNTKPRAPGSASILARSSRASSALLTSRSSQGASTMKPRTAFTWLPPKPPPTRRFMRLMIPASL